MRTHVPEELFLEYGLDLNTRTIYLGSIDGDWDGNEAGVNYTMAQRFVKSMFLLDSSDGEINILSNNPGGDWYHGMAIYDAIKGAKNPVKMTVFGYAMSMGSVILQAADVRVMAPNSAMMIHYGYSSFPSNHPKIMYKWTDEEKKINKVMEQIYLENIRKVHPKYRLDKLQKFLDFDSFFSPQEAIDLGLADAIL